MTNSMRGARIAQKSISIPSLLLPEASRRTRDCRRSVRCRLGDFLDYKFVERGTPGRYDIKSSPAHLAPKFSRRAPQYHPTFELNRRIAELAEDIGLDFLFWMDKWKGFGGRRGSGSNRSSR